MRHALVTGAAGFIGSSVVEQFALEGYRVRALDMAGTNLHKLARPGVEVSWFDLLSGEDPRDFIRGMDVVVHCAGRFDFSASWEELSRVNVDGVHRIALAMRRTGVPRLVVLSSTAIYGRPAVVPCPEDGPKRPRNYYERTKWLGEKAAFAYHDPPRFEVIALRPTLVYGPRSRYGHANFVGMLALAKRSHAPFYFVKGGDRGPVSSHVHVEDVARAAVFAAQAEGLGGESYNVVGNAEVTMQTLGDTLIDALELSDVKRVGYHDPIWQFVVKIALVFPNGMYDSLNVKMSKGWARVCEKDNLVPALAPRAEKNWIEYMAGAYVYDFHKLERTGFAYKHPDFRTSMTKTVAWYRENRWVP